MAAGSYDRVFTVVEILYVSSLRLSDTRRAHARSQLAEAFRLSGSVYALKNGVVEIIPTDSTARKLVDVAAILSPYAQHHAAFFSAVGDLMGRRRKIKDLFVGAEGYLKQVTRENDYGSATKALGKAGVLNPSQ